MKTDEELRAEFYDRFPKGSEVEQLAFALGYHLCLVDTLKAMDEIKKEELNELRRKAKDNRG